MSNYDIRLITKNTITQIIKNNNEYKNIINKATINKQYSNLIYLGWNEVNSSYAIEIEKLINNLMDKDISYRICIAGETIENLEEHSYTSSKDEKLFIPYPSLSYFFNDNEIEKDLKLYENSNKTIKDTPTVIHEGEKILGHNNIEYLVLEKKENIALLKSNKEYLVANGIKIHEGTGKISWDFGSYYNDLLSAKLKFNNLSLSKIDQINSLKSAFKETSHYILIPSIISYELDENSVVNEEKLSQLEEVYDEYCSNDDMTLLSENIEDLVNEIEKEETIEYE